MSYYREILNNTSLQIAAIINRIQMQDELPQELVKPIRGIWLGKTGYPTQWAGNGKLNLYVPYLAGKGDLIAFDYSSKPITAQFGIKYWLGLDHNELVISPMLQSDDDLQSIFPLIAALMFHTNDIDLSDDNFRQWLINNRPKGNKMEKMDMHEDTLSKELFKFMQLRELADNVKITQEMGQALFKALLDRANAIAHEEVSSDALATDTSEFMLALVNNIINSAPKPAPPKPTIFQRVEADEINNMPREYEECRTRLVPRWADSYIFVPVTDDVAEKCFGKPSVESREGNMWFFKVDGVLCKAFGSGQLSISVSHRPFAEVRKAFDRILEVVNEEMNGKK